MASSNLSLANQQGPENPSLYVSTWSEIALAQTQNDKHWPERTIGALSLRR
jgi:hypothetical protein